MSSSSDDGSSRSHALVAELYELNKKNKKLVHPSDQHPPNAPNVTITSWKMNEFKYYDIPSPFPTLARGLFTQRVDGQFKITVRGYDKFFNIGEVPWNTWKALEHHTAPPYTLTLKSNGCIIFIAALSPEEIVVTSKHSLTSEHAKVGMEWVHKTVASTGRTVEQLAATLWENNWTAVAELCDDSFEEHVLPYSKDSTGLHLHGLNENIREFKTMLPDVVEQFSKDWGFIVTKSIVLHSIPEVKKFTDEINAAKEWNGEALEGFVVRTHISEPPTKGNMDASRSPYAPGSSFFFKVKFDEPYMMYRDWRELTKACLAQAEKKGANHIDISALAKKRMQRPETKVYVNWVVSEIKRDVRQFDGYNANHGIIATRERFLKWLEENKGKTEARSVPSVAGTSTSTSNTVVEKTFGKTIIVPVAIPGCGKTTVSVALQHLFKWGHTQSDDVKAKKPAPIFLKNVTDLLRKHDVVIADKNNHLRQHRTNLRDATKNIHPTVRLLALNWAINQPPAMVHRLMSDRITQRGTNHQTLHADTSASRAHEDVLWMFLKGTEELAESEVDVVVEMDLAATPEQQLRTAVDALVRELSLKMPTDEQIKEALAVAQVYKPKVTNVQETRTKDKNKGKGPRYYAILPEINLGTTLESLIPNAENEDAAPKEFWARLKNQDRVIKTPHITLVHQKSLPAEQAAWDACAAVSHAAEPPLFSFRLSTLLWNDRVMALVVDDLALSSDMPENDKDAVGAGWLVTLPEDVRSRLHITVGTWTDSIVPFEARALVDAWRAGKEKGISAMPITDLVVQGRLKGLHG